MIIDTGNLITDLSLNAVKIIAVLYDFDGNDDGLNVTEIAIRTGMHNVSASEYLYKLETAGLVIRRAHPRDRRQALFLLTKKGRKEASLWQPQDLLIPA